MHVWRGGACGHARVVVVVWGVFGTGLLTALLNLVALVVIDVQMNVSSSCRLFSCHQKLNVSEMLSNGGKTRKKPGEKSRRRPLESA